MGLSQLLSADSLLHLQDIFGGFFLLDHQSSEIVDFFGILAVFEELSDFLKTFLNLILESFGVLGLFKLHQVVVDLRMNLNVRKGTS